MSQIVRLKVETDERFVERASRPDQIEPATLHARRQVEVARRLNLEDPSGDNPGILGRELARLAEALRLGGALDEAREVLVEVLEIWDELGRPRAAFLSRMKLADVEERAGNPDEAARHWNTLVAGVQEEEVSMYFDFVFFGRGVFLWRQGRPVDAVVDLEAALDAHKALLGACAVFACDLEGDVFELAPRGTTLGGGG